MLTFFPLLFSYAQLYESFPNVMKYLPGPHNKLFSRYVDLRGFMNQELQRHKKDLDHSNPRDYIDTFLIEMENVRGRMCFT